MNDFKFWNTDCTEDEFNAELKDKNENYEYLLPTSRLA